MVPPVTGDAIRKWCAGRPGEGGLPHQRTGGGAREIRIKASDLAAWVRTSKPNLALNPAFAGALPWAASAAAEGQPPHHAGAGLDPSSALQTAARIAGTREKLEALHLEAQRVKHAKTMGELVAVEDVERTWSTAVGQMGRMLAKLPDAAMPAVLRAVAKKLDKLGIASNKATPAVEELKAEIRLAVIDAVDLIKQRLVSAGQEHEDHGEEQEE